MKYSVDLQCCVSFKGMRVYVCATSWTVAYHTPLSMEFSRQEYWSRLPFPTLGYIPDPGTELASPAFTGGFFFFF